jgi:hypothetical protein
MKSEEQVPRTDTNGGASTAGQKQEGKEGTGYLPGPSLTVSGFSSAPRATGKASAAIKLA